MSIDASSERAVVRRGAWFSDCGLYRYKLWRHWGDDKPIVGFIMLNPSTADDVNDDPTIRRCVSFARSWGYGGVSVCNLFGYRTSNPNLLKRASDPVGADNDTAIDDLVANTEVVVAAWGDHGSFRNRSSEVHARHAGRLYALEINLSGEPRHPLYMRKQASPFAWCRDES